METTTHISEIYRNYALFGAAIIGLPLAIWRSVIAARQAKTAQGQFEITASNHLAETYTKAIDQIGHEEDAIKLGGLYALKKLASTNKDYHVQIMEVLCAFVRLHAPRKKLTETDDSRRDSRIPIPVQTALTIIANRNIDFDVQEMPLDLSSSSLLKANLKGAKLLGVNFQWADLFKADLQGAKLFGADLQLANLKEAKLIGADLIGAKLFGADLREADLLGTRLLGAILQRANLMGAKNLTVEQVDSAIIDTETILPDGITRDMLGTPADHT